MPVAGIVNRNRKVVKSHRSIGETITEHNGKSFWKTTTNIEILAVNEEESEEVTPYALQPKNKEKELDNFVTLNYQTAYQGIKVPSTAIGGFSNSLGFDGKSPFSRRTSSAPKITNFGRKAVQ